MRRVDGILGRFCGYVPLVVGYSSAILDHGTGISSKQRVVLL